MNSTNYSLNAMEVNNARFARALKVYAEEVSTWQFFEEHRVFTTVDVRRMNDVRWSLTLVISVIAGYFNRDSEHEAYLRRYTTMSSLSATSLSDYSGRLVNSSSDATLAPIPEHSEERSPDAHR